MTPAIKIENLSKHFKSYSKQEGAINSIKGFWNRKYVEKPALRTTNLEIKKGQIVGLVGSNGAGKTTLLKLLSGLIFPSTGSAKVLGFTPSNRESAYLKKMSILLGQKNQLWWDISPKDSFALLTEIYDLDRKTVSEKIIELSDVLNCSHVLETQLRRLSLGERMKMEIIGALLHQPEIIFLDEPTIGLDIIAQTSIRNFLIDYVKKYSPTIILTSHYMNDIAALADRLLLISHGHIVYDGSVGDFTKKAQKKQKVFFSLNLKPEKDLEIKTHFQTLKISRIQEQYEIDIQPSELSLILSVLAPFEIQNLKIEESDFEDVIRDFLSKESRVF
jgi:ABC-2 type transport system ATP-binding protein